MILIDTILDLFIPRFCVGCGALGTYLCTKCYSKLVFFEFPLCPGCMKKIVRLSAHDQCRGKTSLDGLLVMTTFDGVIKQMIVDIKYSYYFDETKTLAILLAHFLHKRKYIPETKPRAIIPVPLHPDKQQERGFNQSELLSREIARILKVPTTNKLLLKSKATASQAGLTRLDRLKNVSEVFTVSVKLKKSETILLIDDVVTTGVTLSMCAKALKAAGAGKVYGVALAHGK